MSAIAHFEIHYDVLERARRFYTELFGWKIEKASETAVYLNITAPDGSYGGLMKRFNPDQRITDYFAVSSVLESTKKVEALGGRVLVPQMAVPGVGYYALCLDTEGNLFGLWENDPQSQAKK